LLVHKQDVTDDQKVDVGLVCRHKHDRDVLTLLNFVDSLESLVVDVDFLVDFPEDLVETPCQEADHRHLYLSHHIVHYPLRLL
jgi:hypothetical protein